MTEEQKKANADQLLLKGLNATPHLSHLSNLYHLVHVEELRLKMNLQLVVQFTSPTPIAALQKQLMTALVILLHSTSLD